MKIKYIPFFLFLCVFIHGANALEKVSVDQQDHRIKWVLYDEKNIVPVDGYTFVSTQIVFGRKEKITDVENGDSAAWMVHVNQAIPNVLNLKPTVDASKSNLTVTTTLLDGKHRFYYFQLLSEQAIDKKSVPYFVLKFRYPENSGTGQLRQADDILKKTIEDAQHSPKRYNWNYSFHGNNYLKPKHIFDDGQFTYIEFHQHQMLPSIFSVDNYWGNEAVVNFRRVGHWIVIENIQPQFTFRKGHYFVASIFNDRVLGRK